jgi:hypothetical protein
MPESFSVTRSSPVIKPERDEDPEEDELDLGWREKYREQAQRRFQLVKCVSRGRVFFGVYDSSRHEQQLLSEDRQDALDEIARRTSEAVLEVLPYYEKFKVAA